MAWSYKEYLEKMKSLQKELCSDDLDGTARVIEKAASYLCAGVTGVVFGPSFLLYRIAKFAFEIEKPVQADANWMFWAGQIILPSCYKKGIVTDLVSMDPGNSEERNICFCFNLPAVSDTIGESILREVRNRISKTFGVSVLDIKYLYDISYSKGQIKIARCENLEQSV